jgi:hypothetical protein
VLLNHQKQGCAAARAFAGKEWGQMVAQLLVSWFICDGAFRVHAINASGRRKGRIIEVEEVDTGERFHGSPRRLERLVHTLRQSKGELHLSLPWSP